MRCFLKSSAFNILLGVVFTLSGIIWHGRINQGSVFFSEALNCVFVPGQRLFSCVSAAAADFNYQIKEKAELEKEIEHLKKEVNDLRDITADYYSVKRENARFAKYYDFKESNKSLKFVSASVIGRSPNEFFGGFTIDKGSNSGISVHDAVITENSMVGYVCAVGCDSSRVKTLLSPDSKIGVTDSVTGDGGVISGSLELARNNLTRMIFIPAQSQMKSGDMLVTSGVSGMYPKNLKLGQIKSVEYDSFESDFYAVAEPFENISTVKDVFVITDFRGKGTVGVS